jgi:ADP-ribose pyrophosphatase YjhB (NUDIX family)
VIDVILSVVLWDTRVTVEALVEHGGRLLMIRHDRDGLVHWEVPGGYVEPAETLEEAVVREVVEETGVAVEVGELAAVRVMEAAFRGRRSVDGVFRAWPVDPPGRLAPQLEEGILAAAWLDPADLAEPEVHPMHRPLVGIWWRSRDERRSPLFYLADQVMDAAGRRTAVLR